MIDKDAYRREVLDPARARNNRPTADLLVSYALAGSVPLNRDALDAHLAEVVSYWRTLKQQKKSYAKIIDHLLVEHGKLAREGPLTWDRLNAETQRRVADAIARLTGMAASLAKTTTVISRTAFEHLVAETDGACSEAGVLEILTKHGLKVIDQVWELPDAAPSPGHRTLRTSLVSLGLRLSAEAVVGTDVVRRGFRLRGGFRLTTAGPLTHDMIATAIERSAGRARDEGKALIDSVLSTLAEAAREPGQLDALLLWEVMEILRPLVVAGLPPNVIAKRARDVGLVRGEAEELVLAMLTHDIRPPGVADQIQEALQDGRLRAAELLLPALPDDAPPELRAQVERQARQVADWIARAAHEQAAGRTEAAAELLERAARIASDDDAIGDRLRALPPPPPQDVRTGPQEDRVTIRWTPGPIRVGPVRYRVVRTTGAPAVGAAAGTLVGETDANELVDSAPPAGEDLHYRVFAGRTEGIWSAPAGGPPVTILPEVGDPSVVAGEREVRAAWRLPRGAAGALVTRLGDGGRPKTDQDGFVDRYLTSGRTYRYRIQAAYERSDGTRRLSRGIVVTGLPDTPPRAVPSLSADLAAGDGPPAARLLWTAPPSGRVVIRTSDAPPPWPAGTPIRQEDMVRYGREVPGTAIRGSDGRMALTFPIGGAARCHFVAVSLGAGKVVVGPSATLVVVDPVRELTARRLGDTVALSWIWPSEAQLAEVIWAPAAGAVAGASPDEWESAISLECRRRAYEDDGCRLRVGYGAVQVSVRTMVRDGTRMVRSRPLVTGVPATTPQVHYEFRRPRLVRRRSSAAVLVLTADRPCRLPSLVVVHRADNVLPLRPEQGTVIHTVPSCDLDPAEPLALQIKVPSGRGGLACFTAPGAADSVTLIRLPGTW